MEAYADPWDSKESEEGWVTDESTTPFDIPTCKVCGFQDIWVLVACENKECELGDRVFCKCCSECRIEVPCGKAGHFSCWDRHLPMEFHADFTSHVQCPRRDYRRLDSLFRPETDHSEQVKRHKQDRPARWFIVNESATSGPELTWTNRFKDLCGDSEAEQFPCLVSFIGKTGVGKSTLVGALITLSEEGKKFRTRALKTPVTRINNLEYSTKPTSAGVNLYKDIETIKDHSPIFFADCEGFGVGVASSGASEAASSPSFDSRLSRIPITSSLYSNNKESSRSETVSTLYARFLFAFSDVLCFVANDMQSFAAEIERLLLFVIEGYKAAVNQNPAKTLIYIFNKTPEDWPEMLVPENLEKHVWNGMGDVWNNSAALAEIRETKWGSEINSAEEFLKKYFQEIHFCHIPWRKNVSKEVMIKQYALLRKQITDGSRLAANKRKGTWACYNVEDLSGLFEMAFEHFATQPSPFDFASAAQRHDVAPLDMEDHIVGLLRQVELRCDPQLSSDCPKLIASAFVGHCLPRDAGEILMPPEELWSHVYEKKCSSFRRFNRQYKNCQFKCGTEHCILLSDSHQQIHQDSKGRGIGLGPFKSGDFAKRVKDVEAQFLKQYNRVCDIDDNGVNIRRPWPSASEVTAYRASVLATLKPCWVEVHSYRSCFTCLRSLPDHVLPCGHALCEACAIDFCLSHDNEPVTELVFKRCVICKSSWPPQIIQIKPEYAGVRILTLDGGGVRGILELALWQLVEKEIGLELPICRYFDLIIGTSTGGIIALGMALQNTDSVRMMEKFNIIANKTFEDIRGTKNIRAITGSIWSAFSVANPDPLVAGGMALMIFTQFSTHAKYAALLVIFIWVVILIGGGNKYSKTPLQEQLQRILGLEASMFGTPKRIQAQRSTRIAVLAVKKPGGREHATTFANYNRPHVGGRKGDFERGDTEENEIKAWEAGLCSSAAPSFLPAFKHKNTNTTYLDGGLLHNNPIFWALDEYKKIWTQFEHGPDVTLDILVSLGSGHFPDQPSTDTKDRALGPLGGLVGGGGLLDGEVTWRKFREQGAEHGTYEPTTHHRLNVAIDWYCPFDHSHRIPDLLEELKTAIEAQDRDTEYVGNLLRKKVREISELLVAKLFFFQPTRVALVVTGDENQNSIGIEGKILCRLKKNEKELKTLLERVVCFQVVDGSAPSPGKILMVTKGVRTAVQRGNGFEVDLTIRPDVLGTPIQISVMTKDGELPILISGFPRNPDDFSMKHNSQKVRYRRW